MVTIKLLQCAQVLRIVNSKQFGSKVTPAIALKPIKAFKAEFDLVHYTEVNLNLPRLDFIDFMYSLVKFRVIRKFGREGSFFKFETMLRIKTKMEKKNQPSIQLGGNIFGRYTKSILILNSSYSNAKPSSSMNEQLRSNLCMYYLIIVCALLWPTLLSIWTLFSILFA